MTDFYARLQESGITLPPAPERAGLYAQAKRFGENFVFLSGCLPAADGKLTAVGKVGRELTVEDGQAAARVCVLNLLAVLEREIGSLNDVKSFVKITVFVACTDDFTAQPQVANGASQLLLDLFGDPVGLPSRSAVGAVSLPLDAPVEIEALVELQTP